MADVFVLEHERDRPTFRPYDVDDHGAIRRKRVAFESNRAESSGRNFHNVVIPPGLGLEVLARVDRGVVLVSGAVVVERKSFRRRLDTQDCE